MRKTHRCLFNKIENHASYQVVNPDNAIKSECFGCVFIRTNLPEQCLPILFFTTSKHP